jgi:membrane fusion protein (multidrug efflux system)
MIESIRYFVGCLLIFPILMGAAGCGRTESNAQPEDNKPAARAVQVSVKIVEPTPIRDILILPGGTEAWEDVRVPSDTPGVVEWIGPKEGDRVKKQELIAKIDVSALKAALDRLKAAAELAEELYERRRQLYERKIINKEELDRSETEMTVAQGNLRQAQVEYNRGFVRSPIDGMVEHLFVDKGEFIDRGNPFADLVNVDKIKINVNVPELDVKYLKVDQQTMVTIDAFPDKQILGSVNFVAYKADPATKTFMVRVLIDNPGHEIRPGMIARVAFLRRVIPDALVAPLFSLVDKGGERLVFIEKDGVVQARAVGIGVIERDRVQISSGLEPGDHLIIRGQKQIEEGMRVQVQ